MTAHTPRRRFLQTVGAGAVAAPLAQLFGPIREAFAAEIEPLAARTASEMAQSRGDYLLDGGLVYLNHASIGTMPRAVFAARSRYLELCETNPWLYMWGGAWEEPREDVRRRAAAFIGCRATELVFTHNTTEAFSLLANGLTLGPGDEVVFSSLNHAGASQAWFEGARRHGFTVTRFQFPVLDIPGLSAADVVNIHAEHLTSRTRVLVFPEIDNIVGLRHPVRALADAARARGVEFVAVDAAQTVGMLPVDVSAMGVDLYATSPHKWLQAPKGLGLMYLREEVRDRVRPMWVTWGQGRWRGTGRVFEDYGTRNLAEVLTLGDAIDFQSRLAPSERDARLQGLWRHAREVADTHPRLTWRSPRSWDSGASLFSIEVRGREINEVSRRLYDEHRVVFRPFREQGLNAARISPNVFNTVEEIDRFVMLAAGAA